MKKILIFHHYNSSLGAGLSLLHILKSIDQSNYCLTLCLPKIEGDLAEKVENMGIDVTYLDSIPPYMHFSGNHNKFFSLKHLNNIIDILKCKEDIEKKIIAINPDYIFINSMTLFWIGKIAQNLNKKIVCFHRETYRKGLIGFRTKYIKKSLCDNFNAVVFLSYFDMDESFIGKSKYFRITDKVDIKLYDQLDKIQCRKKNNLPLNDQLILYVGGLAKLKGPLIIVKAMKYLKNTDAKLVFLQYEPKNLQSTKEKIKYWIKVFLRKNTIYDLNKFIKKNNLSNRVIFRPSTDHVEEYFISCDLVVFPAIDVHQARPALEAGISKKPFIITDFPNTKEFIDETNGWLFKKGNYKDLALKIDDILTGNVKYKVKNNYDRVYNNNNLDNMADELNELLNYLEKGDEFIE